MSIELESENSKRSFQCMKIPNSKDMNPKAFLKLFENTNEICKQHEHANNG